MNMMMCSVISNLFFLIWGAMAFPLCDFVRWHEDGTLCQKCLNREDCFAQRKCLKSGMTWLEEWMLISYVAVHNKCIYSRCNYKIRYMLYVMINILLLSGVYVMYGTSIECILLGGSTIALVSLGIVDWNTQYIPFEYTVVVFICGLIRLVADQSNWLEYILGLFLVSGFLYVVNKVATPILRRRYEDDTIEDVIGDGDMKLMAATGLLLGWKLNFIALGLGCVIGSIIQIILMKVKGSDRQFALGPYLSLGVYITMICGEQLVSWYLDIIGIVPM